MSDSNSNSLVNLGKITKPAELLIEKISLATGAIFAPYQTKRMAKAGAHAKIIDAHAEVEILDIQQRATHRLQTESLRHQRNIEAIRDGAIPHLGDTSTPNEIDDDWITDFFEQCRNVSNAEMQELWARILAGEANAPGSFSRRTISIVRNLDRYDGAAFSSLCRYMWKINGNATPLLYSWRCGPTGPEDLGWEVLEHLDAVGLIRFNTNGYMSEPLPFNCTAEYFGRKLVLFPSDSPHDEEVSSRYGQLNFDTGYAALTRAGEQLHRVCSAEPIENHYEEVAEHWKSLRFY